MKTDLIKFIKRHVYPRCYGGMKTDLMYVIKYFKYHTIPVFLSSLLVGLRPMERMDVQNGGSRKIPDSSKKREKRVKRKT